ncbi:Cytochrome c4 [invertebrate metagenome]|uniref:Cytochrome c4 n=1 Tax=invertebrate metagenome TaxID=1711999 RepID=A0A484H4Z1_9ZZZZ
MQKKVSLLALLGGLIIAASSFAADDPPTPRMLSNACAGCHGTNGVSTGPAIPTIAGIDADYFVAAMQGYKKDEWASTVMGRLAKNYSDSQITAMGQFFSEQKFVPAHQLVDGRKVRLGQVLHKQHCEKCHEDAGASSEGAGVLAGQWMPYLRATLHDYISGTRPMSKNMEAKIDAVLKEHQQAGIEALVHFYGSKSN